VTLEITVLPSQLGDDEDSVATLVSALRNGYSHTADGTFLPAPLSFRSKILDYMDRYATDSEDDDLDDGLSVEEDPGSPDDEESAERLISYGQTRRWFEGTSEFGDEDIAVILPKPNTTGMEAKGKFGKHDFAYLAKQDVYRCPAGQLLGYWLTTVDGERTIRRYAHRSRLQADLSMLRWSHDHYRGLRVRRTDSAILTGNIPTCRQIGGLRLAQRASLRFCATKAQSTKQMV